MLVTNGKECVVFYRTSVGDLNFYSNREAGETWDELAARVREYFSIESKKYREAYSDAWFSDWQGDERIPYEEYKRCVENWTKSGFPIELVYDSCEDTESAKERDN